MNLSPDLAATFDGLEPVTLRRRGSTPGSPGTPIAHALRRAVTTREAAASGGLYTTSDVAWHVPTAELPIAPRLGDVLCDYTGGRWTILEIACTTLGARWRCTTRSLALAHKLDDTITILKAVYAKGDGGAIAVTWQPWITGVRARIQPVERQFEVEHAARRTSTRCRIFVESLPPLDQNHRIQAADGTVYKILAITSVERIDEVTTLEAEVTPWP